jgi:hypothetical protein
MGDNHPVPFIQTDLRICWIKMAESLDPSASRDETMNSHQEAEIEA